MKTLLGPSGTCIEVRVVVEPYKVLLQPSYEDLAGIASGNDARGECVGSTTP